MTDWRQDPDWQLVQHDPEYFQGELPAKPTADAELAQPDTWASLYNGRRLVAIWSRFSTSPRLPSAGSSTILVP